MKILRKIRELVRTIRNIDRRLGQIQLAIGRIEGRQLGTLNTGDEYQVYSQWGEDGIIQKLVNSLNISEKRFIEFGVENYTESNTRFLLVNDNWSGLVMDGDEENIKFIKQDDIYWRYNLKAVSAFITAENIKDLIRENYGTGTCGILSIDVDGNDYWIWKAIDCVSPDIVICEYNHRFGKEKAVTIPYRPDFTRQKAHHSMIYYGASIGALEKLARSKGYSLVAGNRNGNNVFFVRNDLLNETIQSKSINEIYQQGQFREARDELGNLLFLSAQEEGKILKELPLVEV